MQTVVDFQHNRAYRLVIKPRLGSFCRGQFNCATVPGEGYGVPIVSGWTYSSAHRF